MPFPSLTILSQLQNTGIEKHHLQIMGRWLHPLLVPAAQITKYLSSFSSSIRGPCLYLPPRGMHFIHTLLLQSFTGSVHQMCLSKWLRLQPKAKQHSWSGVMLQRLFQPLDKIKIDIIKAFSSSNHPFKVIWMLFCFLQLLRLLTA